METTWFQHNVTCVHTDSCIELFEKSASQFDQNSKLRRSFNSLNHKITKERKWEDWMWFAGWDLVLAICREKVCLTFPPLLSAFVSGDFCILCQACANIRKSCLSFWKFWWKKTLDSHFLHRIFMTKEKKRILLWELIWGRWILKPEPLNHQGWRKYLTLVCPRKMWVQSTQQIKMLFTQQAID